MLSISARGNAQNAQQYYEHLATGRGDGLEDYYASDAPGQWAGSGAKALGLEGEVKEGEFMALARGFAPDGEAACQNAGKESHRAGWDLTFSAPKSVSVAWALGDDATRREIEEAHDAAVSKALDYMERQAGVSRVGHGGAEQVKAGLVVSVYRHGTSREQDPQLHSHAFVHNVGVREDGSTATIESKPLYIYKMAGGAAYRAELSQELRGRGLAGERDGTSFRLSDVDKTLETTFSKRHNAIEAEMDARGSSGAKAAEKATLSTRQAKVNVPAAELRARWREEAGLDRQANLKIARVREAERPAPAINTNEIRAALTDHQSTFSKAQAHAEIMREAQCQGGLAWAEEKADAFLDRDPGVERLQRASVHAKGGERFTTPEMRELESRMVERADTMAEREGHRVPREAAIEVMHAREDLSAEQRRMVEHVTRDTGDIACVQGVAGSGKSYALGAARETWEREGYDVKGLALSGRAAQSLEQGSGIESQTVASFLNAARREARPGVPRLIEERAPVLEEKTVLVVDEAGMLGSRQMSELLERADAAGAKVVLAGDTRQLQAIEAGSAFRAIQEKVGAVELNENRRQMSALDREVVQAFRDGDAAKALGIQDSRGKLDIKSTAREAKATMGRNLANDMREGKSSLGLAATREDTRDINQAARGAAQELGLVGTENVKVYTARGVREFSTGDKVVFERNVDHPEQTLEMGGAVKNGERGTIERVSLEDSYGGEKKAVVEVRLESGASRRIDTERYNNIEHGYAVTVHKAQGATVAKTRALTTESKMPTGSEWAYVASSRHREELVLYTDRASLESLAPELSKTHEKDVTLDYTPREQPTEREVVAERGEAQERDVEIEWEAAVAPKAEQAQTTPQAEAPEPGAIPQSEVMPEHETVAEDDAVPRTDTVPEREFAYEAEAVPERYTEPKVETALEPNLVPETETVSEREAPEFEIVSEAETTWERAAEPEPEPELETEVMPERDGVAELSDDEISRLVDERLEQAANAHYDPEATQEREETADENARDRMEAERASALDLDMSEWETPEWEAAPEIEAVPDQEAGVERDAIPEREAAPVVDTVPEREAVAVPEAWSEREVSEVMAEDERPRLIPREPAPAREAEAAREPSAGAEQGRQPEPEHSTQEKRELEPELGP